MMEFYKTYCISDKGHIYVVSDKDYDKLLKTSSADDFTIKVIQVFTGKDARLKVVNAKVQYSDFAGGYACVPLSQFNDTFKIALGNWKRSLVANDFVKTVFNNDAYEKLLKEAKKKEKIKHVFFDTNEMSNKGNYYRITGKDWHRLCGFDGSTDFDTIVYRLDRNHEVKDLMPVRVQFLDYQTGGGCILLEDLHDSYQGKRNLITEDFHKVETMENGMSNKTKDNEKYRPGSAIENFQDKKDISKKVDDLLDMIHGAESILEDIRKKDPDFDAGYKIDAGISRASTALEQYIEEKKKFDFRDLKFEGYKKVDGVVSSATDIWFEKDDNEDDSIHIYKPEFVEIDPLATDYYQYIVVVEILKGCKHHKTMVLDAKAWIADPENLGKKQNLEDMAKYILTWGLGLFKDREVEAYK